MIMNVINVTNTKEKNPSNLLLSKREDLKIIKLLSTSVKRHKIIN